MAPGRARPQRARRRRSAALKRLAVQFRGMGFPEQEIVVTATVKEADGGRVVDRDRRRAGREPDHPQRRGRARALIRGPLAQADPRIRRDAHRAPAADPQPGRRRLPGVGQAGRLGGDRRATPTSSGALDRARRARGARARGLPHPSAHLGRPRADRLRLPLLRRRAARRRGEARAPASGTLDLSQMRREIEEALRETASTLSRMTDLLAVATAPPPSAARVHRVEALQLQPRVGDGGRDRLQRRGDQARLQLRARRSTPAWSSGRRASSTSASPGSRSARG